VLVSGDGQEVAVADAASIEDFVASRGTALLRFAFLVCGNRATAEDLVQTVLGRAYPRWARISTLERPEAYLKTMLVREHLRWLRRLSSGETPVPSAALDSPVGPEEARVDSRDAAWALLARLPRKQRAVLVLRYYEDMADGEIAAVLGCAESTVRSQASRGIAALRAAVPALRKETLL
jgi:RNA polymerase sigma-70 factor (sigma-E family)